ncbi:MAG: hypothetical protein OSB70_18390 [Myxococcota bacterium]|nr:hypothetical protein [Myxococcota bacterium]
MKITIRILLVVVVVAVAGLGLGGAFVARAGPPGVLDDPHAVGKGTVEIILATSGAEQAGETGLHGPIFDLTVGIVDGLDFLLVAEGFFVVGSEEPTQDDGVVVSGLKWQPIVGPDWNAAWTPVAIFELAGDKRVGISNAIQIERTLGRFALGVDASYTWLNDGEDIWRGGVYGLFSATDSLTLLSEVWFERSPECFDVATLCVGQSEVSGRATDFAFNLGFDWEMLDAIHMLGSAGTGIESDNRDRIEWQAFFGFQYVWGPAGDDPDPLALVERRSF